MDKNNRITTSLLEDCVFNTIKYEKGKFDYLDTLTFIRDEYLIPLFQEHSITYKKFSQLSDIIMKEIDEVTQL